MSTDNVPITFGDSAEQRRIRKLCARLPRASAIRTAAEGLLNGSAPDSHAIDECFVALLRSGAPKWRQRTVAAWVLGVAHLVPVRRKNAADVLAGIVDGSDVDTDAVGRFGRGAARTCGGVTLFIFLGFMLTWLFWPLGLLTLFFGMPASFARDYRCIRRVRVESARALGRNISPEHVAMLARGVANSDMEIRLASTDALLRTLPHLTAGHIGVLPLDIGSTLCRALGRAGTALDIAILRAIHLVAGPDAIPLLERYSRRNLPDEQRSAAEEALVVLRARRETALQSERLLRPSAPVTTETLLRPLVAGPPADPTLLLRPSQGEDSA